MGQGCPRCGGRERRLISPGFWECTTQSAHTVTTVIPDPFNPPYPRPVHQTVTQACGNRYHEAERGARTTDRLETCACETFAIGRCSDCATPICGDHSALVDDLRLCTVDARTRTRSAADAATAQAAQELAARQEAEQQARDNEAVRIAALPAATKKQVHQFLTWTGGSQHPDYGHVYRLPSLPARDFARAIRRAKKARGLPPRARARRSWWLPVRGWAVTGGWATSSDVPGWLVSRYGGLYRVSSERPYRVVKRVPAWETVPAETLGGFMHSSMFWSNSTPRPDLR